MEELLSSASLILAAITLLYTVWTPAIEAASGTDIDRPYQDLKADHQRLRMALHFRAIPLAVAATTMSAIFLPVAYRVIISSIRNLSLMPFLDTWKFYDPISAVILFIEIAFLCTSYYLWSVTRALRQKNSKIEKKKTADEAKRKRAA